MNDETSGSSPVRIHDWRTLKFQPLGYSRVNVSTEFSIPHLEYQKILLDSLSIKFRNIV